MTLQAWTILAAHKRIKPRAIGEFVAARKARIFDPYIDRAVANPARIAAIILLTIISVALFYSIEFVERRFVA